MIAGADVFSEVAALTFSGCSPEVTAHQQMITETYGSILTKARVKNEELKNKASM